MRDPKYRAAPPTIGEGKIAEPTCDSTGALRVKVASGGGGAATIADGADVAEGSTTDAAATQGGTGTISAKLRTVTAQLNTLAGYLDGVEANQGTQITAEQAILAKLPTVGTATAPGANIVSTQPPGVTQVISTALEASRVLKASAGQLCSLSVFNSGAAQFVLLMNSATVPADGAVTLLFPPIPIAANSIVQLDFPRPLIASTGIAVFNSSTGTFTKTVGGSDCAFYSQLN